MLDVMSYLWVAVLIAAVGVWIGWALARSPYTPIQSVLVFGNLMLARVLWRGDVPKELPIAAGQGAVIIANHRSSIDPLFIQVSARRQVHWFVAAEFATNFVVSFLYKFTGAIPIKRSGRDTAATKYAIRLAKSGGLIGMFPEGTINVTDDFMLKVRPGAILVALKAGVPILPCYIHGSPYRDSALSPLVMPARVKLVVGQPIDLLPLTKQFDEKAAIQEATKACMRAIAALAGRNDYEPQLAGRRWLDRAAG